MFKRFQIIIFTLFIVTGCVPRLQNSIQPTTNNIYNYDSKKIGYLINVKPYPTHTHIGTTKLTNFTKQYNYNWKIPLYIEQEVVKNLKRLAYIKPINLKRYNIRADEVNGLLKNINGNWVIRRGKANIYKNLVNRLGLSAIIVINEAPKVGIVDCGILGCKEYQAQGYGLLTKGFINTTDFYSATPFWVHIYRLKPTVVSLDPKIVNINGSKKMTKIAIAKSYQIEPNKIGLKSYPQNFKNFTREEFAPFRLPLISYINALSREISTILLNIL
ncbi:MAG: hypothetical protein KAU90_01460 [Sulfurovaceae bacterium]|nr:hypothetical protein [Sulfurovaceae bacterium]